MAFLQNEIPKYTEAYKINPSSLLAFTLPRKIGVPPVGGTSLSRPIWWEFKVGSRQSFYFENSHKWISFSKSRSIGGFSLVFMGKEYVICSFFTMKVTHYQ